MRSLIAALFLAATATAALAQSAADVVRLELLPGWREADGTHMAGLRIVLAPGWKTYWRAPGEAGIPPSFDWAGSSNLAGARTHYPVPDVFRLNGVRTIGYRDAVVLPIALRPRDGGQAITLRGRVGLGVCETVCIPFEARIQATLPAGAGGAGSAEIRAALADAPLSGSEAGLRAVGCRIDPIGDGLRLTARMEMPPLGGDEVAVIEAGDPSIWVSEAVARRQGGALTATADLVPPQGAPFALDRSSLRFTVLADGRAAELHGCGAG
jgi:DsbC/DsbD-like thiol-disulfide interchange protein